MPVKSMQKLALALSTVFWANSAAAETGSPAQTPSQTCVPNEKGALMTDNVVNPFCLYSDEQTVRFLENHDMKAAAIGLEGEQRIYFFQQKDTDQFASFITETKGFNRLIYFGEGFETFPFIGKTIPVSHDTKDNPSLCNAVFTLKPLGNGRMAFIPAPVPQKGMSEEKLRLKGRNTIGDAPVDVLFFNNGLGGANGVIRSDDGVCSVFSVFSEFKVKGDKEMSPNNNKFIPR